MSRLLASTKTASLSEKEGEAEDKLAKFKDLSLQTKLTRIFTYVMAGFGVYFLLNIIVTRVNTSYLFLIRDKAYPLLEKSDKDLILLSKLKASFTDAIVSGEVGGSLQTVNDLAAKLRKSFAEIKNINPALAGDVSRLEKLFEDYYSESRDLSDLVVAGLSGPSDIKNRGQAVNAKFSDFQQELTVFRETRYKEFTEAITRAKGASDNALLVGFAVFILSMAACFFALKFVTKIVRSLNQMGIGLEGAAQKLATTSEVVQKSGTILSDNSREQSEAAAETVSTVVQIQETLEKNVRESEVALESAHQTLLNARQGRDLVHQMLVEMSEIEKANDQLNRITKVMEQIVDKTNVINEIVLQSRILSFNANIEAARAGEFGKGFAVVATEVVKLADMTGMAAVEIQELLEKSTQEVFGLIQNTDSKVKAGRESSVSCEKAFESISHYVADLADKVEFIVQTSKIQANAVQQITQAMKMIDDATHKNYQSVSKTVDVTSELDGRSTELLQNVFVLNELVKGKSWRPENDSKADDSVA